MRSFYVAALLFVSGSAIAEQRVFHLEDLAEKFNSGMTAEQYCNQKAAASLAQAKAANAPFEAQKQIKQWVSLACSLDIIEEKKRIASK